MIDPIQSGRTGHAPGGGCRGVAPPHRKDRHPGSERTREPSPGRGAGRSPPRTENWPPRFRADAGARPRAGGAGGSPPRTMKRESPEGALAEAATLSGLSPIRCRAGDPTPIGVLADGRSLRQVRSEDRGLSSPRSFCGSRDPPSRGSLDDPEGSPSDLPIVPGALGFPVAPGACTAASVWLSPHRTLRSGPAAGFPPRRDRKRRPSLWCRQPDGLIVFRGPSRVFASRRIPAD